MFDYSKLRDPWIDVPESGETDQAKIAVNGIRERKKLLASKEEEIQRLKYESELIERDICSVIRDEFPEIAGFNLFYGLQINLLPQAWRYFNRPKGDSPSKRSGSETAEDEEKRAFEFVDDTMRKTFFPFDKKAKLIELLYVEGRKAYDFVYECMGSRIHVTVPIFAHVSKENCRSMLMGYVAYYEESALSLVQFASSLEYAELAKEIKAFVKKRKEGKK